MTYIPQPRKTCPCGLAEMTLGPLEADVTACKDGKMVATTGWGWKCPRCGRQDEIGADVEASLDGRQRLF